MRGRIASVKESAEFTSQLVEAYCTALWLDEPLPETSEGMLEKLDRVQDQMIEWRESAARVGADEALCWILSIYETIDLDKVPGVRVASKWIKDPELVEKRERKAQLIIETSNLHEFRLHPNATPEEKEAAMKMAMERIYKREQDDEEEAEGEDGDEEDDEEEAEGSEGEDEDDEDFDDEDAEMSEVVDEDIQMDPVPSEKTAPSVATSATAPVRSAEADPPVAPSGGAATATPSGDAAMTPPGGAATTTPSGVTATAPSGEAPTAPSVDAPTTPLADA